MTKQGKNLKTKNNCCDDGVYHFRFNGNSSVAKQIVIKGNQQKKLFNLSKTVMSTVLFIFTANSLQMYKIVARINKVILPSFTKRGLDLAKAKKWQMAIIAWRYYVTKKALEN